MAVHIRGHAFVATRGNGDLSIAFPWACQGERGSKALEVTMTAVKSLAIIALLVGGTSLAIAQNGPPTGGQTPPPAASGPPGPGVIPGDRSAAPSTNLQSAAQPTGTSRTRTAQHQPKHHKHMFMSAKGTHHKPLKTNSRMQMTPKQ
jgi:hypothetical protein